MLLVDSDLSRLPLPDLVLSAVEQLPPPPPQVTVSAPSSPTRDAAFQFPECSSGVGVGAGGTMTAVMMPVPSPRPKPRRRRLTSEGSLPEKGCQALQRLECSAGHQGTCCAHHLAASLDEREWATVGANLRNIADDFHASKTKVSDCFGCYLLGEAGGLLDGVGAYVTVCRGEGKFCGGGIFERVCESFGASHLD